MRNEETKKQKKQSTTVFGETTPQCGEKNRLAMTGWLEVKMKTKNLKMNGMAYIKWIFESKT